MGWIRCVCLEKLQRDFVARTIALIAPVLYVLQQVSCSYEMIPNASKYYETDRNISLGSNGGGLVAFIAKNSIVTLWYELLYELNQFSMFCNKFHAVTKRSQMHPKTTKQTESLVYGPMGWIGCVRYEKSRCDSWHELLH